VVAGAVGALVPLLYLDCSGDFEAPLVGLTLVAGALATFWLQHHYEGKRRSSIVAGLTWGLTSMVSPQLCVCGAIYELLLRLRRRHFRDVVPIAASFIAGVLPWTVRNYIELGSPVFSRDNAGLELYVSNNDEAGVTFDENLARHVLYRMHPHSNPAEATLVARMGEVHYNKLKCAAAKAWIASHPKRFLTLTMQRFAAFWLLCQAGPIIQLYWTGILVGGFWGLHLARRFASSCCFLCC
jgi:hypothetical protein